MKYIKTYGINGLLEWHGSVTFGGTKLNLSFTNGTTSAYGVAPATFTTEDEFTQIVIENSDKFKDGKIKLVSAYPIAGSEEPEPAVEEQTTDNGQQTEEAAAAPEVQVVEVADKAEAVEWLKELNPEKGYTGFKLRGAAAFEAACKENNVEFKFAFVETNQPNHE